MQVRNSGCTTVDGLQWMYDIGWITVESMMSKENDEEEMEFREEKGRIRLDTESKITEGGMQSQESYGSCMLIVVKKKSSRKEIQLN